MPGNLVYIWSYPDGTPFYVGIGDERRSRWPLRNPLCDSIRTKIEREGDSVLVTATPYSTREECCAEEKRLIQLHGRRDLGTGILANLTDGGETGGNPGPETRRKISEARTGTRASDETRRKQSAARVGRKQSPETVAKRSASLRGHKQSPEAIQKRVESRLRNWRAAQLPLDQDTQD